MHRWIAETPRLKLREITEEDAETAYLLNLDPEVIRYTGDQPFASPEEAAHFLRNYDHYAKHGFGRWAVIRSSDDAFLGWCGLKYTADLDEHDLGFRFFRKYWNQGYATESGRECLRLGFEKFAMTEIVGRAMKQNTASIAVLTKLGMTFVKERECGEQEGVLMSIRRP